MILHPLLHRISASDSSFSRSKTHINESDMSIRLSNGTRGGHRGLYMEADAILGAWLVAILESSSRSISLAAPPTDDEKSSEMKDVSPNVLTGGRERQ